MGSEHKYKDSLTFQNKNPSSIAFYSGEVVNIDDPDKTGQIQIKIDVIDSTLESQDLPWCISAMPSFFHVVPEVGENVLVFIQRNKRYYLGPILSSLAFDKEYVSETREETLENFKVK